MGMYYPEVDNYVDMLFAIGFTELRIDIPDYQNDNLLYHSKEAVVKSISSGAKVVWGVSSNSFNNPMYTITASNWPVFRQAILETTDDVRISP